VTFIPAVTNVHKYQPLLVSVTFFSASNAKHINQNETQAIEYEYNNNNNNDTAIYKAP